MIINETYDLLRSKYGDLFTDTTIENVVVGIFHTAVKLSSGYCGVASTDIGNSGCSNCYKKDFGEFSPGNISGKKILDLFNFSNESRILDIIKLTVLNAVSAEIIDKSNYHIIEDKDPIDLIDLNSNKTICLVGAFQSYIKKISATSNKLLVLELNENAFSEEQKKYYVPENKANSAFSQSDIVVITGATLANNTLDNLLSLIPPKVQIIVVGPTSSMIPDVLFNHNVSIIGSTKIIDSERMFKVIAEGGAGYHLFHYCAKKICLLNDKGNTVK